jgi:hypothetical protein
MAFKNPLTSCVMKHTDIYDTTYNRRIITKWLTRYLDFETNYECICSKKDETLEILETTIGKFADYVSRHSNNIHNFAIKMFLTFKKCSQDMSWDYLDSGDYNYCICYKFGQKRSVTNCNCTYYDDCWALINKYKCHHKVRCMCRDNPKTLEYASSKCGCRWRRNFARGVEFTMERSDKHTRTETLSELDVSLYKDFDDWKEINRNIVEQRIAKKSRQVKSRKTKHKQTKPSINTNDFSLA